MSEKKQPDPSEGTDLATLIRGLGDINRDGTKTIERLVATLRERAQRTQSSKKGSITIKIDLKVTEAAVELSAALETKAEGIGAADVYYLAPDGRMLRTHPKQLELVDRMNEIVRDVGGDGLKIRDITPKDGAK